MNNQKIFTGVLIGYLVSLVGLMLTILICAFLKVKILGILIIIFMLLVVIGYVLITILKTTLFRYECSVCHHTKKMSFGESLFAARSDDARLLKCPYCHADTYMERVCK